MNLCECGCGEPTTLIVHNDSYHGSIAGQYRRFVKGHNRRKHMFWPDGVPMYKIEGRGHETPCWIWLRGRDGQGYGTLHGAKAHVTYYEQRHGAVPDGLELDHLCRVRECVNPDHLEPVTHAENIRRAPMTKLTIDVARAIRASTEPAGVLAARYGLASPTVHNIRAGRIWKDNA